MSNTQNNYEKFYFKAVYNKGEKVVDEIRYYQVSSVYAKAFAEMVEEDWEIIEIYCEDTGVRCAIIEQYIDTILSNFNGMAVYGKDDNDATIDHIKIDYVKLLEIKSKKEGR